ncbi:MAG: hypothetical protein ACE5GE_05520 [Phycisphaerae bacterium]
MSVDDPDWSGEGYDDEDDGAPEMLACPACGAMVYEETQQCPQCGDWIVPHAAAARRKSPLWIVAAVLALAGMLFWLVR